MKYEGLHNFFLLTITLKQKLNATALDTEGCLTQKAKALKTIVSKPDVERLFHGFAILESGLMMPALLILEMRGFTLGVLT